MKKLFLLLILVPLMTYAVNFEAKDIAEPTIVVQDKKVQINLPKEALQALKKWNSKFSVFEREDFPASVIQMFDEDKAQPMAFVGDFEGNGKKGIALWGDDGKSQYVVALLPRNDKWEVMTIFKSFTPNVKKTASPSLDGKKEFGVPYYILAPEDEFAKKLLPKSGIQVETYLGIAEVYVIKNGKSEKVMSQDDDFSDDFTDVK